MVVKKWKHSHKKKLIVEEDKMTVRETRKRLDMTQRELAITLAFGKNGYRTVQRYETGERTASPSILKLMRYIEIFGDIDDAFGTINTKLKSMRHDAGEYGHLTRWQEGQNDLIDAILKGELL